MRVFEILLGLSSDKSTYVHINTQLCIEFRDSISDLMSIYGLRAPRLEFPPSRGRREGERVALPLHVAVGVPGLSGGSRGFSLLYHLKPEYTEGRGAGQQCIR